MKALERSEFREALSYINRLMDACVDSSRFACLYMEALLRSNPNDMTNCISFSTKVQSKFIEAPEFLFWRGRVLLYNGQQDMGRKHIKQALQKDPDCLVFQKFWKNLQKADRLKTEAAECFQGGKIDEALQLYRECLGLDPLNNEFNMTIYYN